MPNKAFKSKKNPPGSPVSAVDEATFKAILANGGLATWAELEEEWAYDPYLVHFTKRTDDPTTSTITFEFVDCNDPPKAVGVEHTISLSDVALLFPERPSTIPAAVPAGGLYGFVMLNPRRLTQALSSDIAKTNSGTLTAEGKWPRGASIPVPLPPAARQQLRKWIDQSRQSNTPITLTMLETLLQ